MNLDHQPAGARNSRCGRAPQLWQTVAYLAARTRNVDAAEATRCPMPLPLRLPNGPPADAPTILKRGRAHPWHAVNIRYVTQPARREDTSDDMESMADSLAAAAHESEFPDQRSRADVRLRSPRHRHRHSRSTYAPGLCWDSSTRRASLRHSSSHPPPWASGW